MKMKEEFLEVSKKLNLKTNIEIKELEDFIFFLGIFQNFFSNKKLLKKNSEVAELLEKIFEIKFTKSDRKSRPLLLGKSIKYFYSNIEELYINNLLNKMYRILYLQSEEREEEETWDSFLEKLIKEWFEWLILKKR